MMAIFALQSSMCNMTFGDTSPCEDEVESDACMAAGMTRSAPDHSAASLLDFLKMELKVFRLLLPFLCLKDALKIRFTEY